MPEGHTLVLAAWRLAPFAGKTVRAESVHPRGSAIARALHGATLGEPGARGKHLLWPLADGRTLHSHLRMQGSWRVFREGERWTKPARQAWLVLRTDVLVAVQFNGPVLELLRPGALALHPVLARLGPDVLAPGFDPADAALRGLAASEDRAVAEVLLDQRVACGLGNIAKSEALWACRTDPFAAPGALGAERLAEIYDAGRAWLTAGVQRGGDAPRRIYGQSACPRCHGRSARRAQGDDGRTTWWCPACQSG
jgi:endonuclease-8